MSFVPRTILLVLIPLLVVMALGAPYYQLPLAERLRSPLHAWFRPSGIIGQAAGFAAVFLFCFLWLYPIRKKFSGALAFTGPIRRWLDAHIIAGLLMPLFAGLHAGWRFEGLIGVGYGAMCIVSLSGVIGRYLYTHIPRSRNGLEMTCEEMAAERRAVLGEVSMATGLPPDRIMALLQPRATGQMPRGYLRVILHMITDDLERRRAVRTLIAEWRRVNPVSDDQAGVAARAIARLSRREMALSQQIRILDATQAVFRFWHVAHRPLAVTAFVSVLVHVIVVVALGATWIG